MNKLPAFINPVLGLVVVEAKPGTGTAGLGAGGLSHWPAFIVEIAKHSTTWWLLTSRDGVISHPVPHTTLPLPVRLTPLATGFTRILATDLEAASPLSRKSTESLSSEPMTISGMGARPPGFASVSSSASGAASSRPGSVPRASRGTPGNDYKSPFAGLAQLPHARSVLNNAVQIGQRRRE